MSRVHCTQTYSYQGLAPSPPFNPSARPWSFFGKKKEMLLIDDANAPPPTPENIAAVTSAAYVQSDSRNAEYL